MKKNIIIVLLLLIICSACKTTKIIYQQDCSYEDQYGYKNLYFVDTIQIDDPVCVILREGYSFIMSREAYHTFDASDLTLEDLLHANYAFIDMGIAYPPYFLELVHPTRFCSYDSKDLYIQIKPKNKAIARASEFESPKPLYFLLFLINGCYYNSFATPSEEPSPIKGKNNENTFYKIVIPVCKD